MDLFHIISEERIRKAYKDGEFENLPGRGKPLPSDDLAGVPEELRMAYKLLKNAGYTEEESHLRRELTTIEDLMKKCDDQQEREGLRRKLNEKLLRFNQMMFKRGVKTNSSFFKNYEHKVHNKLK